jgi:hypothetical protein
MEAHMDQTPMGIALRSPSRDTSKHLAAVLAVGVVAALAVWLIAGPTIGNLIHPRPNPAGTVQFGTNQCAPKHQTLCLTGQADSFSPGLIWYLVHVRHWLLDLPTPGYDVVRIVVSRSDSHGSAVVHSESRNLASKQFSSYGVGTVGDFDSRLDARQFTSGTYTVTVWWERDHSVEAQGTFRIT